jgi:hypothetical protein
LFRFFHLSRKHYRQSRCRCCALQFQRDFSGSQTNLYNQRPTSLDLAHIKLAAAVFAAYVWTPVISDEEILAKLLELNLETAHATETGGALAFWVVAFASRGRAYNDPCDGLGRPAETRTVPPLAVAFLWNAERNIGHVRPFTAVRVGGKPRRKDPAHQCQHRLPI